MQNRMVECSVCHSKLLSPTSKTVSRAYDRHRIDVSSKTRVLNILLVVGDCIFVGLQPILVYMSKVDGKFMFSPVSVNFLTEATKMIFAIVMLLIQGRHKKVGEKSLLSLSTLVQAARNNVLLAIPALLYAINNYLKFIMQSRDFTFHGATRMRKGQPFCIFERCARLRGGSMRGSTGGSFAARGGIVCWYVSHRASCRHERPKQLKTPIAKHRFLLPKNAGVSPASAAHQKEITIHFACLH